MELISTIINELTNVEISLTSPLMKTKVLANRIRNKDLLKWVNNELEGYSDLGSVPDYRQTKGEIAADYMNGRWKATNQPITFPEQNETVDYNLYVMHLMQSIQVLESYKSSATAMLAEPIIGNQRRVLEQYLLQSNPYLSLQKIYRRIPINYSLEILSKVRNRLLDFMLEIEVEYDTVTDIKELKIYNESITKIMNTIINNTGDGVNIISGSNNTVESSITRIEGNKEQLKTKLLKAEVSEVDVELLFQVIDNDLPKSKDDFGQEVNEWIGKMINKAIDGSWKVSIGAAGTILAQALQNYYGLF